MEEKGIDLKCIDTHMRLSVAVLTLRIIFSRKKARLVQHLKIGLLHIKNVCKHPAMQSMPHNT
jgi:hypothetical protein